MADQPVPMEDVELEDIANSFLCCICLDLLYKPVILSCGHISCFWCVRRSMNNARESHCPICRRPYLHFPSICRMLHYLLVKMYPDAYKRREKQTLEEEKRFDTFSPQFDGQLLTSWGNKELNASGSPESSLTNPESRVSLCADSTNKNESFTDMENGELVSTVGHVAACSSKQTVDGIGTVPIEEENIPGAKLEKNCKLISISDVLCVLCKQLLFCPVVLNCGDVYCESCFVSLGNEKIKCQECQSHHPGGLPSICLELDNFLKQQFPEEYALRKSTFQPKQSNSLCESSRSDDSGTDKSGSFSFWKDPPSKVHIGAGCDYCGMYPIIGDRYQCQDCEEKIGFDLCSDCYSSSSKLPGRFNQQHKPEHKFKLIKPYWGNFRARLLYGSWGYAFGSSDPPFVDASSLVDDAASPTSDPEVLEDSEFHLTISLPSQESDAEEPSGARPD